MSAPFSWSNSPAKLLADHAWARRLARQLVRDVGLADDLAQEACARALQHPPGREPRAWLGGIVRNLARELRRQRGRRERREASVARAETQPSAADTLARLAAQQDVVRAVFALAEPYRSTVVLRYYDGLPPRKIAAHEGVPVATVKTRLARALTQLRAALEREHGRDGRSWALVLFPLVTHGRRLGPLLAGAALMNTLVKLGLAAAALALLVWFARREPRGITAPDGAAHASTPLVEPAPSPTPGQAAASVTREVVAPVSLPAGAVLQHATGETIAGRVIDVLGLPVGGVELGLRRSNGSRMDPEESDLFDSNASAFGSLLWTEALQEGSTPLAVSGSDGRFALDKPAEHWGCIVSTDPFWESVATPSSRVREGEDQILVVAPRIRLAGVVRNAGGAPLAEVELRFGVPRQRLYTAGASLEDTMAPDWSTTSDTEGRFELARLPAVPGAILRARLAPYESLRIEREQWSDDELEIVLARAPGAWLEGVVEAHGRPVPAAVVALGVHATKTDAQGAFQLHLEGRERAAELCAAATGFLPARVSGDYNEDGTVRWPPFVRIELAGEPLALAGTVVDTEGRPLAGQEIWLAEGRAVFHDEYPFLLESVLAGEPGARRGTKSAQDGRFELGGLEGHEYELCIVDPHTALVSAAGPFAAGRSDLRLVQPTDQLWPVVRGVVISGAGVPIPGLHVQVQRDTDLVGVPSTMYFRFRAHGSQCETDANGAFELRDVPQNGVVLSASGIEVVDPEFALARDIDALDVRIVVDRWVQLEVHVLGSADGATTFAVLDAAGQALEMESASSGGTSMLHDQTLVEGRSPVVKVNDRAAFVVLYDGSAELRRQAVVLRGGGVNRIEF